MDQAIPRQGQPSQPWVPMPGPMGRVSFFKEQRRHRRRTCRLSALCVLTIVATGMAVSAIVIPLLLLFLRLSLGLASLVLPVPAGAWRPFRGFVSLVDPVLSTLDGRQMSATEAFVGFSALLLPSVAITGLALARKITNPLCNLGNNVHKL